MKDQLTIEIEYGDETARWTFVNKTPAEAKELALDRVPLEADIHRVGGWTGGITNRPEDGHENGFFTDE